MSDRQSFASLLFSAQGDGGEASPQPDSRSEKPPSREAVVEALYRQYYQPLCAIMRRKFGPGPPEPEDAVQAAFQQLSAIRDPAEISNPKAYLYRIAHNFVLDHRRRHETTVKAAADVIAFNEPTISAGGDPSRVLEGKDDLQHVVRAITKLDPRRRDILIMRSIEGLSCAEIGRRLGLSGTRVVQLYGDALAACANALSSEPGEGKQ